MKITIKIALAIILCGFTVNGFAQKAGHISLQELVQLMPETAKINKELETLGKTLTDEIEVKDVELKNKVFALEQNRANLSEQETQVKWEEVQKMAQELEDFNKKAEQDFQNKQNELFAPIIEKAQNTIKKVAKDNGVAFILDSRTLLYADEATSFDLLPLVKKELGIQ